MSHKSSTVDFNFKNKYFHFVGEVAGESAHGFGILYLADGGSLEGTFEAGELSGSGIRRWKDGSVHVGCFKDGEPHGAGRSVKWNGDEFEGEFKYGQAHGQGRFVNRATDVSYAGEFKSNLYDGRGVLSTPQFLCIGEFRKGLPHGDVEISYANGDVYAGVAWKGKPRADSCLFVARSSGIEYEGPMRDGKRLSFPAMLSITQISVDKIPIVATSTDPFCTVPQHHKICIHIETRKKRPPPPDKPTSTLHLSLPIGTNLKSMMVHASADNKGGVGSKSPAATKRQSAKDMRPVTPERVDIYDPCESESNRIVRVRLFQLQSAGSPNFVFDANQPLPIAGDGVSPAEIQLASKMSPVNEYGATTMSAKAQGADAGSGRTPRKSPRKAQRLEDLDAQQQLMRRVRHALVKEAILKKDAAAIEVLPLLIDPGYFMLVCELDTVTGFQCEPGDASSTIHLPQITAQVPLRIVRQ